MTTPAQRRQAGMRHSGVGTGTTSLLMIFTVLCFATLAMLSLSTAAANERLQQREVERSQAVASARGEAAETVAVLDAALWELQAQNAGNPADYSDKALLLAVNQGFAQSGDDAAVLVLDVPVNEQSLLRTEIRLLELGQAGRYELVRQRTVSTEEWAPSDGGQLWQGN